MTPGRLRAVAAVIAGTTLLAVLLAAWSADTPPRFPATPLHRLALFAVLVLANTLQVHMRHRNRTTEASDLFWVALAVCAVAFGPVPLVAVAALGKLVSQVLLRVQPVKAAFNTATAGASAAAIGAVLSAADGVPLMPALALALAAGWAVNHVALVAVLFAAGEGREVVDRDALARWALYGLTTSVLGILLALAWTAEPTSVVLFAVPAVALHAAGRSVVSTAAERRRLSAAAEASRVLSVGTGADLAEYCSRLGTAFGSDRVFLLTGTAERPVALPDLDATTPAWAREALARLETTPAVAFDLPGDVASVLAVALPGRPGSVLAVADPTGARERPGTELAFLAGAAAEVDAFLHAQALRALAGARLSRLETVVSAVADGIVTVDGAHRVIATNRAAELITGMSPAGTDERVPLTALGLRRPDGTLWQPEAPGGDRDARVQVRAADGSVRHVDMSVAPVVLDDEPGQVLVLRDVTAAVARDRARREFIVGLGHELRTPLTPLLGWAQTVRRKPQILDGPIRDTVVEALSTQTERLARLVDNLLTAVDPQAMVSARAPVDLTEVAERQVAKAEPLLGARRVRVVADGPVVLTSSGPALDHIIGNLLSNVARYVPETGTAVVTVHQEQDRVVLVVADTGPGVPPGTRQTVFDLFSHATGSEANPGAGVGLTTSRTLARVLGGDLQCLDPADEPAAVAQLGPATAGAVFRLVLPVTVSASLVAGAGERLSDALFG